MLHVYGSSFQRRLTRESFRKFLLARFARIYPLHLFTLLASIGLFAVMGSQPTPTNNPMAIPTNLLLINSFGIHSNLTWNIPSWSISAEWWAYMLFPMLTILLGSRAKIGVAASLLLFIVVAYWAIEFYLPRTSELLPPNLDVTYDYGFLRGLAGFILGVLMYPLYTNASVRTIAGRDSIGLPVLGLTIYALHTGINDALCIPLFAGIVLCFAANRSRIQAVCNYRPLQYMGEISYSIYMVHTLLIFLVTIVLIVFGGYTYQKAGAVQFTLVAGLLYCSAYLIAVIIASAITYKFIELPARNYLNNRFKSPQQLQESGAQLSRANVAPSASVNAD